MTPELQRILIDGGVIIAAALISWFASRKLNEAGAAKALSEAAKNLIDPMNKRIAELEAESADLKQAQKKNNKQLEQMRQALRVYARRVAYLMTGTHQNIEQLKEAGLKPVFIPDDWIAPEVEDHD